MKYKVNMNMNDDFFALLKTIADSYTFEYSFFDVAEKKLVTLPCKCLTMANLNQIIEASIQDTSMQVGFYSTITNIFKKALNVDKEFNIIDRLLYILQSRSKSVAPTKTFAEEEESPIVITFDKIADSLRETIIKNIECFSPKSFVSGDITITCHIPTVDTDILVAEEFYKHFTIDADNEEDVKMFVGQNFMIELAKCVKSITIQDSVLDFSSLSFEDRLKAIEEVPTVLMQDVINYNKSYKKLVNECLTVEDFILPINGSLFLQ